MKADLVIEQAGTLDGGIHCNVSVFVFISTTLNAIFILLLVLNLLLQLCKLRNSTRSWRRTWPRSEKVCTLYGRVHRFASHLIKLIETGFVVVLSLTLVNNILIGIIAFATFPDGCSPLLGMAIVLALSVSFFTQGVDATSLCMRGIRWCYT